MSHKIDDRFALPEDDATRPLELADGDRYRLTGRISQSAQSAVWRARDTLLDREVVVKRLTTAALGDRVARRRLDDEAAAADAVRHANTLPLLDTITTDTEMALVFPYVEGETLARRLARETLLQPALAARIALDIADALTTAHASGVVHRDIKPANILLAESGEARLIDFGIASVPGSSDATEAAAETLEMTGSGMAIGTLRYMAPEQLTGAEPTPAADIFALGVVLYEMLAGRRPFAGDSPVEQLALQQMPAPPLAAPEPLRELVSGALELQPDLRLSATQMARSLRAWLESPAETDQPTEPLAAAPVLANSASPSRRRWAVGLAAAACLIALAVTATALPWFSVTAPPADEGVAAITTPKGPEATTPQPPADDARPDTTVAPRAPDRAPTVANARPAVEEPASDAPQANNDKPDKPDKPKKDDKPGKDPKPKKPKGH